jgi:hypothetical protein
MFVLCNWGSAVHADRYAYESILVECEYDAFGYDLIIGIALMQS